MTIRTRPAVFLGPLDLSGYYACLTRGLRAVGCRAEFLSLGATQYAGWQPARSAWPIRAFDWASRRFWATRQLSRLNPLRYLWTILTILTRTLLVGWVALRFDVIVLKSGEGLWRDGRDIRLYRRLGRTVIAIFHGSDSRPPYLVPERADFSAAQLKERAIDTRRRADRAARLCSYIVDNPLSAQYQSAKCCMYQMLGNMIDEIKLAPGLEALRMAKADGDAERALDRPVRILHAPSVVALKGTDEIRACIERMRRRGYQVDYVEVSGRPNSEVMRELARCDFVIDELYSDIHGAFFALEASAFARPSVVCGLGLAELERIVPLEARLPTVFCHPDKLDEAVERLLSDSDFRNDMGARAQAFFRSFADCRAAAERLLRLARGEAPPSWFFDPAEVSYVKGVAGREYRIRANIAKLVGAYGPEALLLDDKPVLKQRVLDFMAGDGAASSDPRA